MMAVRSRRDRIPYVRAVGEVVLAWNAMHDLLAELFWVVTGIPNGKIPLDIWHSIKNDWSQRDILRATTNAAFAGESGEHRRIREEIKWLLDRINSLAEQRNNAIHAPLIFVRQSTDPSVGTIIPATFFGNPRAKNLVGKDLLKEFNWYRQMAVVLGSHALRLKFYLRKVEGAPWPDRPLLPSLGQKNALRDPHPRRKTK